MRSPGAPRRRDAGKSGRLRHLLVSETLVEPRSDLDLCGEFEACFVESVDLLDRYEQFFDHQL